MFRSVRASFEQMATTERRRFVALLVGRSLTGFLDVIGVFLIGIIGAAAAGTIATSAASSISFGGVSLTDIAKPANLITLAVVTLGFFLVKAVLAIFFTSRLTRLIARVEARIATQLTERMLRGSLTKLEHWSRSELSYGLTLSMHAAYGRLLAYFATLVTEGVLLVLIAAVLFVVSPVTMLVVIVYFAILGLIIQRFVGKRQQRAGNALAIATVDATDSITETVGAYREIVTLGRQPFFVNRFGDARTAMADSAGAVQFVMSLPRYIVETALILGVVLLIGAQLLTSDLTTAAATLGIFITAGVRIMASLLPLQTAAGSIGQVAEESKLALGLLAEYAATSAAPTRAADTEDRPSGGFHVQLSGVSFQYEGSDSIALRDVDFEASPGQYVAIIGASGAGKSTLADMLLGLIEPTAGTIELDGASAHSREEQNPGSIAYVPQRPGLVAGSILENVALGRERDEIDEERALLALDQANLGDYVRSLPEGVNTSVGKQTSALSGGQIQRLGLARALYVQPRLLVLDEATSALDAESESVVGDSLRLLHGSVTMIVIAHRLSTVQHADVVHLMEDGRITASGSFADLRESNPTVARYAELMSLGEGRP